MGCNDFRHGRAVGWRTSDPGASIIRPAEKTRRAVIVRSVERTEGARDSAEEHSCGARVRYKWNDDEMKCVVGRSSLSTGYPVISYESLGAVCASRPFGVRT